MYLLLKVAVVSNTLIMSQILLGALKQYLNNLFNIKRKLCKATKYKQLLLTYKKYEGMKLKFHLSLCNHYNKLKDVCSKILRKAPTGIRDEIIKALEKEIRTLKTKRHNNRNNIKNKTTRENYKLIKKLVAEKVVTLEQKVKSRQVRKLSRDNIQPTTSVRKRNRRFKKDVIVNKRKEKRKRYRSKKKQSIKEIKQNAPDQNAINFSNSVLSEEQKSLLKKGPSFVPTPTDINW